MANEVAKMQKMINSDKMTKHFEDILKDNAAGFLSGLSTVVALNPDLAKTNIADLTSIAMRAAVLDLSVLPDLGEAYVIPYGKNRKIDGKWVTTDVKPQFQLGYRGIIKLVQNTGRVGRIGGSVVYEANKPHYNYVFDEFRMDNEDYDPYVDGKSPVAGYIAFYYLDGERIVKYWPLQRVVEHALEFSQTFKGLDYKDKYGNKPKTPWYSDFDAMAIKTVMKDLLKFAPKTTKVAQAMAEDDRSEREVRDVTPDNAPQQQVVETNNQTSVSAVIESETTTEAPKAPATEQSQQNAKAVSDNPFADDANAGSLFNNLEDVK